MWIAGTGWKKQRNTGRNRPSDPHFRNWWRTQTRQNPDSKKPSTKQNLYNIFRTHKAIYNKAALCLCGQDSPIWGLCERQEGTVHTRTLTYLHTHANQLSQTMLLWAPRSVRKLQLTVPQTPEEWKACQATSGAKGFSSNGSFFSSWNYKLRFYQNWHFFFQLDRCNNGVGSGDIYPFLLLQV